MIAVNRIERPQVRQASGLLQAVRNYLRFIEAPAAGISYEARLELKRLHHQALRDAADGEERGGATLTEVLIALLILGIGIVSLAVLFPISVMRSIKATQFTTATDARFNAEATIDLYPNMLWNPDGALDAFGNRLVNAHYPGNFIVDPLGAVMTRWDVPGRQNNFGNDAGTPWASLARYQYIVFPLGGAAPVRANEEAAADKMVMMPDSWVVQYTGAGSNPTPLASPTQIDVAGLSSVMTTLPAGVVRAVIFSADGQSSQTRTLTQITGNAVQWSENANGVDANGNGTLEDYQLPASFVPGGKVRIEMQERRYTWLYTVRKDTDGNASVDVVVFFKRKFESGIDELLYPATFTSGSTQVTGIQYTAANKPHMKKGSYIFDANNAYWYRISNVTELPVNKATVILDTPANASSPAAGLGIPPARAMFPRNIVDVYPIGGKSKG